MPDFLYFLNNESFTSAIRASAELILRGAQPTWAIHAIARAELGETCVLFLNDKLVEISARPTGA